MDATGTNLHSYTTGELVAQSNSADPVSLRWQRCTDGSNNPMKNVSSVNVGTWTNPERKIFTGYYQQFLPDGEVIATFDDGMSVVLEFGRDYVIRYAIAGNSNSGYAVRDEGSYTATFELRGAYIGDTTYATPTAIATIASLDISSDTYDVVAYCVPDIFDYTGQEITPKTMVRLDLGEAIAPTSTGQTRTYERYSYLPDKIEATAAIRGREGEYFVSYSNNVNPGTATAFVAPTNTNLINSTQAPFLILGDRATLTLDAGEGTFLNGAHTSVIDSRVGMPFAESDFEVPTRDGYEFAGWLDTTGKLVTFPYTIPSTSATITAFWKGDPIPPAPTPAPIPEPTPGVTPASDSKLLPSTGDVLANTTILFCIVAASMALLGSAFILQCRRG